MNYKQSNNNSFIKKRLLSFKYAFKGVFYAIKTQHNLWIHLFISTFVVIFGYILTISYTEWLVILLCFGLVMVTEIFNTSIEVLTDLVSPEFNTKAGKVKDLAAAAVLISSVISALTGIIIFLPKLLELL